MASYKDIPSDIIENLILPKLPSKSLLKFMSVSKSWYSLIKSPKFIASHLNHHKRQPNSDLILLQMMGRRNETNYLIRYNTVPHHIQLRSPCDRFNYVVASYDGFICLSNVVGHLMLWNPSIHKFRYIPHSPTLRVPNFIAGFGYNSLEDNYKLVMIRYGPAIERNNNNNLPEQMQACAHVYSLNRQGYGINSGWNEISVPKVIDANLSQTTTSCFANEMIHWINFRHDSSVVAGALIMTFDPKTNCFGEIMFPEILNGKSKPELELAVISDNIAVVEFTEDNDSVIVWRMEESKSWKPFYTIKSSSPEITKLGFNWEAIDSFNPKMFPKQKHQQQVVITPTCSGLLIVLCVNSDNSGVLDGALVTTCGEAYTCTETLVLLD